MSRRRFLRTPLVCALAGALATAVVAGAGISGLGSDAPLALGATRITIEGTSNIHAYTASTTDVRLAQLRLTPGLAGPQVLSAILARNAVEAFELTIPSASLSSPKDGLDKNMHKALKVKEFPNISFRLLQLEPAAGRTDGFIATGILTVAGVEREVALDIVARQTGSRLSVTGVVEVLMTDFGIPPPKAMLGMLRTSPEVTITFETALEVPLT